MMLYIIKQSYICCTYDNLYYNRPSIIDSDIPSLEGMISPHLHDTLLQELLTRNMHNQRAIHVYYKSIHKRYNRIIGSQKDIDPGGSCNLTKTIHLETQTISHKQISKLFTLQILNGQVLEHQSLPIKS